MLRIMSHHNIPRYPDMMSAAIRYLWRGWSIVPIRPRDKYPLVRWKEFQERRPTEDEIADWFKRWPDANIGVVTGALSDIVVLDVDPHHGGAESLDRLVSIHGPLPSTVEAETGGGGRHIYFAHPKETLQNKVGLRPGLDLRADGGLIVLPPSIHPSGQPYKWRKGHGPEESTLAPLPNWLHNLAAPAGPGAGHPIGYWRQLVREGVSEGARNNTIASLTGHLLYHGVDPEVVLDLMLTWNALRCRPPLDDGEIERVVHSICRLHQRNSRAE